MGLRHRASERIADVQALPDPVRAVLTHYGEGGMSLSQGREAIEIQGHVDDRKEKFLDELFQDIARELETGEEDTSFSYDTKLTFPAELALGKIYEETGPDRQENDRLREAEEFTDLVMGLLVEGDMRDAIHDEEYGDFETDAELDDQRVAETAQQTLFDTLQPELDQYPEEVREAYEKAVDLSMSHQDEDEEFRKLFEDAQENPGNAEDIIEPYRTGETESRFSLDWSDTKLPFFASQYERVGVLYDGMFEMYEEAGFDLDEDFRRSIVLSTIGAQIWLDDVDDLEEDWKNSQLTPVTAELLTSDSSDEAYENIVSLKDEYLDAARDYAERSSSHLAGISIEYIDRRGEELDLEEQIENTGR